MSSFFFKETFVRHRSTLNDWHILPFPRFCLQLLTLNAQCEIDHYTVCVVFEMKMSGVATEGHEGVDVEAEL